MSNSVALLFKTLMNPLVLTTEQSSIKASLLILLIKNHTPWVVNFQTLAFRHKSSFLHLPCYYREAHLEKHPSVLHGATMQLTEFNILLTLVNFLSDYLSLQELSVLLIWQKRHEILYLILTVMIWMLRWIKWAKWWTFSLGMFDCCILRTNNKWNKL